MRNLVHLLVLGLLLSASGCGGGDKTSSSGETGGNNGGASQDIEPGQIENQLGVENVDPAETLAVGGAGSAKTCSAALSASKSSTARQSAACKLAELTFVEAQTITFNADFRATGSDYLSSEAIHTGIDLQGHPKPSNSRIAAMLPGTVVGINDAYGQVVTEVSLRNGLKVQVGYMHMTGIAVTKGQAVTKGTILGFEGGKGPSGPNAFARHLHIEMRSSSMSGASVLSTAPKAASWTYALDPLHYADEIHALATNESPPDAGQVSAPATPINLAPGTPRAPGPSLSPSAASLTWQASQTATTYEVGVRDIETNALFDLEIVTSPSIVLPALKAATRYRWNVRACNSAGCSPYSSLRFFQTEGAKENTPTRCTGTDGLLYDVDQSEPISCPSDQQGSKSHTCQSDGRWGPITGTCTTKPPTVCIGNDGREYPIGSTESLTCAPGETGSPSRTCQPGGSWGATQGICTPPPPVCVGNDGREYPIGGTENLSCPPGQIGSPRRTCRAGGSWGATSGVCTNPVISLTAATKTGNLVRRYKCASGSNTCVQAGITLTGQNMTGFDSIKVTWSGSKGKGSDTFTAGSGQITSKSDASIELWPSVFDASDAVGNCYTWTFSVTKAGVTTSTVGLAYGPICRPAGV